MTRGDGDTPTSEPHPDRRAAKPHRRRPTVAEVFGDVLPDTTRDERSDRSDSGGAGDGREEQMLRDVPPHH